MEEANFAGSYPDIMCSHFSKRAWNNYFSQIICLLNVIICMHDLILGYIQYIIYILGSL